MIYEKPEAEGVEPLEKIKSEPVRGLQRKLLGLTIIFVMIAEVLAFVPSVANTRIRWINDRLSTAAAASIVIDNQEYKKLSDKAQSDTLMTTGTRAIILRKKGVTHIVASVEMPPVVLHEYNMDEINPLAAITDAFDILLFGGNRIIRVFSYLDKSRDFQIELILDDTQLRYDMLIYSRNVLIISLIIAAITAGLLFFTINRLMLQPIRRLTSSMKNFSNNPEDATQIIKPGKGNDELWLAAQHLSAMQTQLHHTLRQQKRLADLGLAVSKINHDMRNILTSAQLISDRMANIGDPMVKRFAPKLLQTIDRAVDYSGQVMGYGQAQEAEPKRRALRFLTLVEELENTLSIELQGSGIEFVTRIPNDLEINADGEQLFRVLYNLVRNAIQALKSDSDMDPAIIKRISLNAELRGENVAILIEDTGPGMPEKAKKNLFKPFKGSTKSGGTGLGLAIARELVQAHGGDIILVEKLMPGTQFEITLPHFQDMIK